MNTSQALFGGLALIAAAVLAAGPEFVRAQDGAAMPRQGPYQLMTSFQGNPDVSARQVVFRIDARSGGVSACVWDMSAKEAPACSPWSKAEAAAP